MTRGALRGGLALGAVCTAAAIAYAPSFAVPFQFDDFSRLGQNWYLQHGYLVEALLWLGTSRIVPGLTLVLNYQLGGFDPFGFHVLNFAVHLLATVAVFALALTLCSTPRLRETWNPRRARLLAIASALLFACHPLQTQAVTYIIQRYASIAALFYLWSLICYLHARNRQVGAETGRPLPFFIAAVALAVGAMLSKENAASLPGAMLLAEWVGFGWPRRWRALALGAVLALAVLTVPVVWKAAVWKPTEDSAPSLLAHLWSGDGSLAQRQTSGGETPPLVYLMTQAVVLPRYLRLVVLPWGQNIDPDVPLVDSLTASAVAAFALLCALALLGVALVRRRPLLGFAILWFFITLSVESSVIGLTDVMAEHRMYLPMAGLALGIGSLFVAAVERAPRLASTAGVLIAAGLVALTFARNLVWLSPVTLWVDAAEKSPAKARPHTNAGAAYHAADRFEEAVEHYCRALELNSEDQIARTNLGIVLESLGALEEPIDAEVIEVDADGSMVVEMDDVTVYCPSHDPSREKTRRVRIKMKREDLEPLTE